MIWHQLTSPWQGCVEEAWTAYVRDRCLSVLSLQICKVAFWRVAVIVSMISQLVGIYFSGHRLAHAEINALLQIEWSSVDPRTCILYTTTEPCPLCVGAIRMTLISEVRYASRDDTAGSTVLFGATPFLRKGNVKIIGPERTDLEVILIAMLVEFALTYANGDATSRYEQLTSMVSEGARLGQALFVSNQLRKWKDENKAASFVLDQLAEQIR